MNLVVFAALSFTVFLAPGPCNIQFSCSRAGARKSSRRAEALTHSKQIHTRRGKENLSECLRPQISFPASEDTFSSPHGFRGRQYVYFHFRANLLNVFVVTGILLIVWRCGYNKRVELLMLPSELCHSRSYLAEWRVTEQSLAKTGCKMQHVTSP